jgi:hypothetical protein
MAGGRKRLMTMPKIQTLGIRQLWPPTYWHASGYVEGINWLEAWGQSMIDAMEALETLAAERMAAQALADVDGDGGHRHSGGGI